MRVTRTVIMPVEKLRLSPGIRERTNLPRVHALAANIKELGLINDPVVSTSYEPVAGEDRIAAHLVNKTPTIQVKVVEGTPEELRAITLSENCYRRHNHAEREQALQELMAIAKAQAQGPAAEVEDTPNPPPPMSVHAPLSRVRASVGRQLGIQAESVRKAEYRAAQRKRRNEEAARNCPLETWGVELENSWRMELVETIGAIQTLQHAVASALGRTRLLIDAKHCPVPVRASIVGKLEEVSSILSHALPYALCPYCKGVAGIQEDCEACHGTAWLPRPKMKEVPSELKDPANPMVVHRGQMIAIEPATKPEPVMEEEEEETFSINLC